jgi:hypothetical protein
MAASDKAKQAEIDAFKRLSKLLGNPEAFAEPAGFDTGFPDFGFRLQAEKKNVDVHIEYKADPKAQMGSMRDWKFNGKQFIISANDKDNSDKQTLIAVMNSDQSCVKNGVRILKDAQMYFDKKVTEISSGMLTIEKDQKVRRAKLLNFTHNTANYQLAKIENADMGQKILDHYHNKFVKSIRSDADHSILMMMIGKEIWFIEEKGNLSAKGKLQIAEKFGVNNIAVMNQLKANLEVRIQPRGLSSPNKPVSIDVMASFRLAGRPSAGTTII